MRLHLLWATLCLSATLCATNYYVSPNGTGSGTSYSSPCAISTGVSKLASSDTLFLLGGQYDLSTRINISKSGTSSRMTAVHAYPGEKPILDFRTQVYGERGISIAANTNYVHLKGITVRYAGKNGIINYGSYCTIENCDVYGCGDTGIQHKTGGHNYILNCDSHENFDYQLGGITASDFGGNADGFADKQYTGGANTYEGCRSWNNSDDGWDFFQHVSSSTPTIMKNCICFNNGPAAYDMRNHPRYNTDKTWFDQFASGLTVTDADGENVLVSLANYINWGNGNGFKLGGGYTNHDVQLFNCLAVSNTVNGFDQNNNYGTMTIYNASGYANGSDFGFGNRNGGTLIVKNSVSLNCKKANTFACLTVTNANNTWNTSGVNCTTADFTSLDTSLVCKARQADGSLPLTMFMQLVEGSDLIDAGVNVGLPYNGSAPDLGCYELGALDNYPGSISCITANASQSVVSGTAIEPITFQWGGGATGISASGLPQGISTSTSAKTITLSGTPTQFGTFTYTMTTTGGSGDAATLQGTLSIKSNSAKRIAYITTPDSEPDAPILARLNANMDFLVTQKDAATNNDYSSYDLVVISPVPHSTAASLISIEGLNKPMLLLKPFLLKESVWNWGAAANSADADMTITNPAHAIFQGLQLTDNTLHLFNSVTQNGVTYISSWVAPSNEVTLATPVSANGSSIAEVPVGSDMNGTTITQRFLMIGLSEYSTASLTQQGAKLIENSCYYLLGMTIPSSVAEAEAKHFDVSRIGENLVVNGNEAVQSITLLDLSGKTLIQTRDKQIFIGNLQRGIYLLRIDASEGCTFQKIGIF